MVRLPLFSAGKQTVDFHGQSAGGAVVADRVGVELEMLTLRDFGTMETASSVRGRGLSLLRLVPVKSSVEPLLKISSI